MGNGNSRAEGRRLDVLVVDDDEAAREGIALTLVDLGCTVTTAEGAGQAVELFLRGSYDLITLDHRMPGLSGSELHKILSQEFGAGKRTEGFAPRTLPPVLIITGYASDPEVLKTRLGEGVIGVIQKPMIQQGLVQVVERLRRAAH